MSHIAGLRPGRRLITTVAIAVTVMSGPVFDPVLAQDSAVFAGIDRSMEQYLLDAHIPGMVWGIVQDGRLVHVSRPSVWSLGRQRIIRLGTRFSRLNCWYSSIKRSARA